MPLSILGFKYNRAVHDFLDYKLYPVRNTFEYVPLLCFHGGFSLLLPATNLILLGGHVYVNDYSRL